MLVGVWLFLVTYKLLILGESWLEFTFCNEAV